MAQKKLLQIEFGSYIELCVSISGAFGLATGILMLLISILGGDAAADLFFFRLNGIMAGAAGLAMMFLMLAFIGLIFGAITYLPFNFYLRIRKGIIIGGEWEEKEKEKQPQKTAEPLLSRLEKQDDLAGQI